ncbi:acyltransferase family protein [Lacticaseibacillus baoqingensis]|uniref:Acyltransferase family protein n=1 Tax=Lacticaseibacillus baoqingensis TaxID=2486013 RepID=A0ABW4ECC9_9LACO|nr:acyltransferase family protein [Lacticaseibacillus baoqingensis]
MGKNNVKPRRYITGFDGLRTLGVLGVILYHLRPDLFAGGYLGVPIFMVVSGYLITDGLLMQLDRTGTIAFKPFFIKRIKRLYPGLIAVLFATSAYIALFARDLLHNLHWMVLTNLAYVYNWWQILHGQSYFARFANNESPFTHLWTLSIEGQYYLVWPFVVLGLWWLVKNRGKLFNVTFLAAVASAGWMFILYHLTMHGAASDPSRLYYGTDTRAFSILLGAALAFIWPSAHLSQHIGTRQARMLDGIGTVALLGMLAMVLRLDAQSPWLYQGGMFLFSLLTMLLVAVVAHPGAHFNRLLTNPVFSWVGSRSYGLYLYQFPVMIFWEDRFRNIAAHPLLYPVIEVVLIVLLTELSYRFIEQPLAHFNYRQTWPFIKAFCHGQTHGSKRWVPLIATVIFAIGAVGIGMAPGAKSTADSSPLAKQLKQNKADKKQKEAALKAAQKANAKASQAAKNRSASLSLSQSISAEAASKAKTHPVNREFEPYGLTQVQLQKAQTMNVTAIGDSVMLDGKPMLQKLFPQAFIDAAVSRQMASTIAIVDRYAHSGALADTVVIGLGTNGPFSAHDLAKMMRVIGTKRQVYWVNVHVPTRAWQNQVNGLLTQEQAHYPNLHIIDWYHTSVEHGEWFYDDQVHMNPTGNPYYATLIAKSLLAQ